MSDYGFWIGWQYRFVGPNHLSLPQTIKVGDDPGQKFGIQIEGETERKDRMEMKFLINEQDYLSMPFTHPSKWQNLKNRDKEGMLNT